MSRRSNKSSQISNSRFYELLGVEKNASDDDLKKAYRRLAMRYHPDKCSEDGAAEKFQEIQAAYEVLSNSEKRQVYDKYGEEGIKEGMDGSRGGGMPGGFPFSSFFGGAFGGGGRETGVRRGEDAMHSLSVSLEDLYNGKTSRLSMSKNVICAPCKGKGGEGVRTCTGCGGNGIRVVNRSMGFMQMQQQISCPDCSGEGEMIKSRCTVCRGNKTVRETKTLEVHIEKGMVHGQKITFEGEGDQTPGILPGSVIIVLQQKEHTRFKREGENLHVTHFINLVEALCGFQFVFNHLDQRKLLIQQTPGQVIKPGDIKSVANEGFPNWKRPFDKGYLFIKFDVQFPDSLPPRVLQNLEVLLPSRAQVTYIEDEVYHCQLQSVDPAAHQARSSRRQATDEDDDDDPGMQGGPQRVQCAQS